MKRIYEAVKRLREGFLNDEAVFDRRQVNDLDASFLMLNQILRAIEGRPDVWNEFREKMTADPMSETALQDEVKRIWRDYKEWN